MAAQDRDDLLRLLAKVRAFRPRDRTAAGIQTEIERKLQAYLRPARSSLRPDPDKDANTPPAAPAMDAQ